MGKRAVILGGMGFIGRGIVQYFAAHDVPTIVIDRKCGNIENIQYIEGSAFDINILSQVVRSGDDVFHFADSSVPAGVDVFNNGMNAVKNLELLCQFCADHQCRLIFASSGGTVYGEALSIPTKEDAATQPISSYGLIKTISEQVIQFYGRTRGMAHIILRIANCYGEGFNCYKPQGLIGQTIHNLVCGNSVKIIGNGMQVRDYIYIQDVATACLAVFQKDLKNFCINVGSGEGTAVIEVVKMICKELKLQENIKYEDTRCFDVSSNILDCTLAEELFGWSAQVNLGDGIARTCRSYLQGGT